MLGDGPLWGDVKIACKDEYRQVCDAGIIQFEIKEGREGRKLTVDKADPETEGLAFAVFR